MPLTLLRHATQKPPIGPLKLDLGHPYAPGLAVSVLENEIGSNVLNESVSKLPVLRNAPGTSACGSYWDVSSPWGVAIRHDNTGTAVTQAGALEIPAGLMTSQVFSLLMAVWLPSGFGNIGLISAGTAGLEFRVNSGGTLEVLRQAIASFGTSTATVSAQAWHTVGFERNAANVIHYYIDGVDAGGSATVSTAIDWTQIFGICGPRSGGIEQANGWYSGFLHMWNGRAIGPSAFKGLHSEPFALWQTQPLQRWFVVASGAAPVADTARGEVGLNATGIGAKVGVGKAVASTGFNATCTAVKIGAGTARGQAGFKATGIGLKFATATAEAEVGAQCSGLGVKVGVGTARAEVGAESTATAVHLAAVTATAQISAGYEGTASAIKIGVSSAVAQIGCALTGRAVKITTGTARASAGYKAVAIGIKPGTGTAAPYLSLDLTNGHVSLRISPHL